MDSTVLGWRKQKRTELIAARQAMSAAACHGATATIGEKLSRVVLPRVTIALGMYWPIRHEVNLLSWARGLAQSGRVTLCLPVVVARQAPVEYWRWVPDGPMEKGAWDIPVPAQREVMHPDVVLAPLVGFDRAGFRLGYGSGYFDRTLAAADPRPTAIGVGYMACGLDTIFPQAHDIAMHAIITEGEDILPAALAGNAGGEHAR